MLIVVFIITIIASTIAVSGGNGILLVPILSHLDFDLNEILFCVRICAIFFLIANFMAIRKEPSKMQFEAKDWLFCIVACLSALLSISIIMSLSKLALKCFIMLIMLILFTIARMPHKLSHILTSSLCHICISILAGICGALIGGAGLLISLFYQSHGYTQVQAVKKRMLPSLIIQLTACLGFLFSRVPINYNLLAVLIIATYLGGYLGVRLFLRYQNYRVFVYNLGVIIALALMGFSIIVDLTHTQSVVR